VGERFSESVLVPGAVRQAAPHVAWARFWVQGWRFSGRASRSEYLWCIGAEVVVAVVLCSFVPQWLGIPTHWTFFADPFGAVPSVADGTSLRMSGGAHGSWWGLGTGDRLVWPVPYDFVVLGWLAVTALPRMTLLVRRLHDRDRSGFWWLALLFLGPIGWIVVSLMVIGSPRPTGARFDAGLWTGRPPEPGLTTTVAN
jgi:uncharacterized membrane protein YhaH (DUF805 family)